MPKKRPGLIDTKVGAYLRSCRQAARMNQKMAGRVLDVSQQMMRRYENGKGQLLFSSVCELAATFGRTPEQFVAEMKLPYSNLSGFAEVEQDPYMPPASMPETENAVNKPGEPMLLELAALENPKDRQCVQDYYNALMRKQLRLQAPQPLHEMKSGRSLASPRSKTPEPESQDR